MAFADLKRSARPAYASAEASEIVTVVPVVVFSMPRSVRDAVHKCGANRLGHATRLIEDPELTQYVNDRRIGLEICLTSNVQTHAAKSYETNPLRAYFDRGMNLTLNTDNRLMSGTTLTDEYLFAARHLDFSFDELCTVALNGFESAFVTPDERARLISQARTDIAALRAGAS
jgi:adenosine deaminase